MDITKTQNQTIDLREKERVRQKAVAEARQRIFTPQKTMSSNLSFDQASDLSRGRVEKSDGKVLDSSSDLRRRTRSNDKIEPNYSRRTRSNDNIETLVQQSERFLESRACSGKKMELESQDPQQAEESKRLESRACSGETTEDCFKQFDRRISTGACPVRNPETRFQQSNERISNGVEQLWNSGRSSQKKEYSSDLGKLIKIKPQNSRSGASSLAQTAQALRLRGREAGRKIRPKLRTAALVFAGFILAIILPLKLDIPFVSAAVKKGLNQAIVLVVPEGVTPEEFLASLGINGDILKIGKSDKKGDILSQAPRTGPEDLVLWILGDSGEESGELGESGKSGESGGGFADLSRYQNQLEIKDYDILVKATPMLYSNSFFTLELWAKQLPDAVILDSGLWRLQKSGNLYVFSFGDKEVSFSADLYIWRQIVFSFDGINLRAFVDGEETVRTKVAVLPEPRVCEVFRHSELVEESHAVPESGDEILRSAQDDEDGATDGSETTEKQYGLCDLTIKKSGLGSLRIFNQAIGKKDVALLYNELAGAFERTQRQIVREEPGIERPQEAWGEEMVGEVVGWSEVAEEENLGELGEDSGELGDLGNSGEETEDKPASAETPAEETEEEAEQSEEEQETASEQSAPAAAGPAEEVGPALEPAPEGSDSKGQAGDSGEGEKGL